MTRFSTAKPKESFVNLLQEVLEKKQKIELYAQIQGSIYGVVIIRTGVDYVLRFNVQKPPTGASGLRWSLRLTDIVGRRLNVRLT